MRKSHKVRANRLMKGSIVKDSGRLYSEVENVNRIPQYWSANPMKHLRVVCDNSTLYLDRYDMVDVYYEPPRGFGGL